ncbi:MAG: hypothetical protein IPN13_24355 [Bacteroidetes bacterium]|nr:hypothetical protein [Bacteroidota bacterium]
MRNDKKIAVIMEQVKELTAHMAPAEKESFRDELLAWLLFGEIGTAKEIQTNAPSGMRGLTEKEKEMIKQLAERTEALYKISRRIEDSDCD